MTRDDSRDTALAIVLLLLVLQMAWRRQAFVTAAVVVLVLAMTAPRLFAPAAVVWLAVARRLGHLTSTLLLTLVFALIVTPIGLIRRRLGWDALQMKRFKDGTGSVMRVRAHTFTAADLEKPY